MKPPDWFIKLLALNHPSLSVRWGVWVEKWVIGQQSFIGPSEVHYLRRRKARLAEWIASGSRSIVKQKKTLEAVSEELESALAGQRILFMPDAINQLTYDMICQGEHARYGGYARFCDVQEKKEIYEEADRERVAENKRFALISETYDQADFVTRKRQDALKNGHGDLGYLLHGVSADRPLITLSDC